MKYLHEFLSLRYCGYIQVIKSTTPKHPYSFLVHNMLLKFHTFRIFNEKKNYNMDATGGYNQTVFRREDV